MNDLLKEAIADAKAVRETALANAKIALEEAFTPRLQSMLSAKLAEEEGMDEPEETNPAGMDVAAGAEAPAPAPEPEPEPAMEGDYGDDMDEDLELEAIIRELEGELAEAEGEEMDEAADKEEMDEAKDKEEMDEVSDSTKIGTGDNKMDVADGGDQDDPGKGKLKEAEDKEEVDEDISLDEIIAALREGEHDKDEMDEAKDDDTMDEAEDKEEMDEAKEEELKEAYNVIRFLRSKINEVNLLNAKLLFSNKLFRNHSLNENQKMKVIENFDRATTLREVKLVYSTLAESFNVNKAKRQIKESYASAPSRSTAPNKTILNEGNELTARWKKLANL